MTMDFKSIRILVGVGGLGSGGWSQGGRRGSQGLISVGLGQEDWRVGVGVGVR